MTYHDSEFARLVKQRLSEILPSGTSLTDTPERRDRAEFVERMKDVFVQATVNNIGGSPALKGLFIEVWTTAWNNIWVKNQCDRVALQRLQALASISFGGQCGCHSG